MEKQTSKVRGESSDGVGKQLLVSQSSSVAKAKNTSDMLDNSPTQARSQIGFQATKPLAEPKETTNARLVVTFATELGELVFWKKLELVDGQEVFALCFPTNSWTTNAQGELVIKS